LLKLRRSALLRTAVFLEVRFPMRAKQNGTAQRFNEWFFIFRVKTH